MAIILLTPAQKRVMVALLNGTGKVNNASAKALRRRGYTEYRGGSWHLTGVGRIIVESGTVHELGIKM